MHTLVYADQCPNCVRFIDALSRTSAATQVALVDVSRMSKAQREQVTAVPALIVDNGTTLYGTKAFEWLKQFEADVELESFVGNGSLPFSDVNSVQGYATYAEAFSTFEPVAE